jgi:hypothetical protein
MTVMLKAVLLVAGAVGVPSVASAGPVPADTLQTVTVRQVLTQPALVGETVLVKGRCLGKDAPTVAWGTRPFSGDIWQIEDNGLALWVMGHMPGECSGATTMITAVVALDTLPKLSPPRYVRQYLVVM